MPAAHKKVISFSEYKEMSDEIKGYFKPEFERIHDRFDTLESKFQTKLDAIDSKFDAKFDAIDSKFDAKFDSLEKRLTFMTWFLPFFITLLAAIMTILNFVMK
jgi:hypothetical protein